MSTPGGDPIAEQVAYDKQGLVPCVVQDWSTGEVLTLAYMNDEALRRTRQTGELHLWSRSRGEPWHKGETSGNVQKVRALEATRAPRSADPHPGVGVSWSAPCLPPRPMR